MSPPRNPSSTGVVERAFMVLQAVVSAGSPIGVRELERRTGVPRSTAARLLGTLERLGMVERDHDGGARPGTALVTLQTDRAATPLGRDLLRPLLVEMVDATGESSALAVDDHDAVLYLSQVSSSNPVRAPDVSAERHPFHLVAPGLAIMAEWPADRLERHLTQDLVRATRHSVTGPELIRSRLIAAAADGFVWTEQELDEGVNGLATAIVLTNGGVASVSLYGPAYRFGPASRAELGPYLRDTVSARVNTLLRQTGADAGSRP